MDQLTIISIVCIVLLLVLLFSGMNIGLAMLLVGFIGYAWVRNFDAAITMLCTAPFSNAANYNFSVIPLFTLMGCFAFASGLSQGLFDVGNKWLGWLPGGLACATVAACAGFGAICGSAAATAATMGTVAIPEMRRHGYQDRLSCGCVAAGGTLGILIPPSTCFILYGVSSETSIGALFAAGVIPGIILTLIFIATIAFLVKRNPDIAPKSASFTWRERFASLKGVIGVVILFAFVIGGLFAGWFTANEAAAMGAFMAFIFMFINKKMSWKNLFGALKDTVKTFSMVYVILIGAGVFGNFLAVSQLPSRLSDFVVGLDVSKYVILAFIVLVYAFLGCIMDGLAMVLLTVPIFLPIVLQLGFDPIYFGVVIVLVSQLGLITPPVGLSAYVIAGVAKDVPLPTIFRGIVPFVFGLLLCVVLVTAFPILSTWLPSLLYP